MSTKVVSDFVEWAPKNCWWKQQSIVSKNCVEELLVEATEHFWVGGRTHTNLLSSFAKPVRAEHLLSLNSEIFASVGWEIHNCS